MASAVTARPIADLAKESAWFRRRQPSQRLSRLALVGPGGTFFVTSERVNGRRRYTVRRFEPSDGSCVPVAGVGGLDRPLTGSEAMAEARKRAGGA